MKTNKTASVATGKFYIESSALIATLIDDDREAWRIISEAGHPITSALTITETNRALIRARTSGRVDEPGIRRAIAGLQTFIRRCDIVPVSDEVLTRAGRIFPAEPIRTLDAIHIATAELLGEPPQLITFVTRDKRVAENARALGYSVS